MAGGVISPWRVVGISVRGQAHILLERPNDDRFETAIVAGRYALCVVADGAGSAAHGGRGAECAAKAAAQFFVDADTEELSAVDRWEGMFRSCLGAVRNRLEAEARDAEIPLPSLATTLQVVLASDSEVGRLQVGDGATVVVNRDAPIVLTPHAASEFVNETDFVTGDHFESSASLSILRDLEVAGVAVFTDGMTPLCLKVSSWTPHEGFFGPAFQFFRSTMDADEVATSLAALLGSEEAQRRSDDDRTIVLAIPNR